MRKVTGFTIIELVVVITILGILAAVALPKFIDVQNDAYLAASQGIAGGIASGTAINYGARLAKGSITGGVLTVATCADAATTIAGGLPANYTITDTGFAAAATASGNGTSGTCIVTHNSAPTISTAVATVIAVTS